jgi:hypothetical protein
VTYAKGTPVSGGGGYGVAFNPANGSFYVVDGDGATVGAMGQVTVINESTWAVKATLPVMAGEYSRIAIDPIHQLAFVAGGTSGSLSVFNATTLKMVRTFTNDYAADVAVDPAREIVVYTTTSYLVFLNYATWTFTGNVTLSDTRIAIDPAHDIVAAGNNAGVISMVQELTHAWITNVSVTPSALPLRYDAASGRIVVGSNNLAEYSTFLELAPSPVTNGTFTSIADSQDLIPVGGGTDEVLFLSSSDLVVYGVPSNSALQSVSLGAQFAYGIAIDPKTLVAVAVDHLAADAIPILPTLTGMYKAIFTESGLPSGTTWCITYNASMSCSVTNTIYFYEALGSFLFSVATVTGYTPSPTSGTLAVTNVGASQLITFSNKPAPSFPVYFNETGLPAGTSWSVTLNGVLKAGATSSIVFSMNNGSYLYTIQSPVSIGSWKQYVTTTTSGTASVTGANTAKAISYAEQYYLTTGFSPSGSATSVSPSSGWYNAGSLIQLSATATFGYEFSAWAGTGPGSYSGTTEAASFSLTGSDNETAVFTTYTYTVTFTETGLSAGVQWAVNLSGSLKTSTTPTITFSEANGTYGYTVPTLISIGSWKEFTTPTGTGSVKVNGANTGATIPYTEEFLLTVAANPAVGATVSPSTGWYPASSTIELKATPAAGYTFVSWTGTGPGAYNGGNNPENYSLTGSNNETASLTHEIAYKVTFNETGLPSGAQWWVNLSGVMKTSITSSVVFDEPNGSYNYSLVALIREAGWREYVAAVSSGNVVVNGGDLEAAVTYAEEFLLNVTVSPTAGGTAVPVSGWLAAGSVVELRATANTGYHFDNWVGTGPGAYSGTANPDNLTLSHADNETAYFSAVATYAVTFSESGLPAGTQWAVNLSGISRSSTTSVVSFSMNNGSYTYAIESPISVGIWRQYLCAASTDSVQVSGSAVNTLVTYNEDFRLNVSVSPSSDGTVIPGTGWHARDSNVSLQATGANGYTFSKWVGTGPGAYSGTVNPAIIMVTGSENETAYFVLPTYTVRFYCENLTSGTGWSVTLDGNTTSTNLTSISFSLTNGTYPFVIGVPLGYTATPSSGNLTVIGHATAIVISFVSTSSPTKSTDFFSTSVMGIPLYWLIIAIAVILIAVLLILYSRREQGSASRGAALPAVSTVHDGPQPPPVRPPTVPKAEWSEDGIEARGATSPVVPIAKTVPQRDPSQPWAITLTPEGVEVLEVTQEGQGSTASAPVQSGQPWIDGGQTTPKPSPPSPVDVYNVLKTLERGPRSVQELEWRVEIFGRDRMPDLLAIMTKADLVFSSKSSSGVYQYGLTQRGLTVVREKAGAAARPVVSVQTVGVEPVPAPTSTGEPQTSSGHALGEERLTTEETSPFGSEIRPEDVNPQLKGKENLSKQALQPLEIRVQADRGADTRDTTIQSDSDKQAQTLMEKASKARRRPRGKFGVEQEAKPEKADRKNEEG